MNKSKYFNLLVEACGCEATMEAKKDKIKYNKVEALFNEEDTYDFKVVRALIRERAYGGLDASLKIIGPTRDPASLFECYTYSDSKDQDRLKKKVKELESIKEHIDNFISAIKKEIK